MTILRDTLSVMRRERRRVWRAGQGCIVSRGCVTLHAPSDPVVTRQECVSVSLVTEKWERNASVYPLQIAILSAGSVR